MVSTLFSFKDSTIHNLPWKILNVSHLSLKPGGSPSRCSDQDLLQETAVRSYHSGNWLLFCLFVLSMSSIWDKQGFGFRSSSYERDDICIYLGASGDFQIATPQHQWTILVELVELRRIALAYIACCIHALQVWLWDKNWHPFPVPFLSWGVRTVMITVLRIRNVL